MILKVFLRKTKIVMIISLNLFTIFNVKAQETVHYPDERYHWNCIFDSARFYAANFVWFGSTSEYYIYGGIGSEWEISLTDKELRRPAYLQSIVFPSNAEKYVYGIAGTAIGCNNPYGCYFYLCKKIDGRYIIIDSAAWSHTGNYKYIDYSYIAASPLNVIDNLYENYESVVRDGGVPALDTVMNTIPIFEAFFEYPLAVNDTFYIGMNSNGVIRRHHYSDLPDTLKLWTNIDLLRKNYSFIMPLLPIYHTDELCTYNFSYIHAPFDEERQWIISDYHNFPNFFPILAPPTCPTIMETKVDSLTYCSAHIGWRQTYVSSYCRIEYGEEGFVRGSGTMVDNITTTDVTLNNLLPNTGYDVYLQSYCAASDTVSGWRKISFVTLDTMCPALENLRMLYVRDVRAKIRWDNPSPEVSHCELEWGESGFEQGQGNYVRYVYDTSYSFLSLAAGTTYDVYIRTYCPRSNVYGDWQKLTFTTDGNSINEAENQLPISVNPNPTTGMVEVTLPQGYENQTVEVYDVQGKLLQSQCLQNGKATFNLSEYPNGVYVIKVGNASCRVVKSK